MFFGRTITPQTPFLYSPQNVDENVGDVICICNIALAPSSKVIILISCRKMSLCLSKRIINKLYLLNLLKIGLVCPLIFTLKLENMHSLLPREKEKFILLDSSNPSKSLIIWMKSSYCINISMSMIQKRYMNTKKSISMKNN